MEVDSKEDIKDKGCTVSNVHLENCTGEMALVQYPDTL